MFMEQLSVFVDNRPGSAAQVLQVLRDAHINLRALCLADAGDFGILRLIVSDLPAARGALQRAEYATTVTPVLAVRMPDTPGAMYEVLRLLGQSGVNVEYAYAYTAGREESATLILRVNDADARAAQVLREHGFLPANEH